MDKKKQTRLVVISVVVVMIVVVLVLAGLAITGMTPAPTPVAVG